MRSAARPANQIGAIALAMAVAGCGGELEPTLPPPPPPNPAPAIAALRPDTVITQEDSAVVTILGSGFVAASVVLVGTSPRQTTLAGPGEIRITLGPADLAEPRPLSLRVSNPSPGGGISAPIELTVAVAVPTITRMEALEIDSPTGPTITITGTGFIGFSRVLLDGRPMEATTINRTTIKAVVPDSLVHRVGAYPVRISNAPPGGGISNQDSLRVIYGIPEIESVNPSAVWRGRALRMTVFGKRFRPFSILRWNGQVRAMIQPSYSATAFEFTGGDFGPVGIGTITIETPGPFGGTSPPAPVRVYADPPKALSVFPSVLAVGSGPTTVSIRGRNLVSPNRVLVGTESRSFRLRNDSTLEVDLQANDLSTSSTVPISVGYPTFVSPSSDDAVDLGVTVLANNSDLRDIGIVNLTAFDIAADSARKIVYAATADVFGYPNLLVAIDAATRLLRWSVPVGAGRKRLAISDDGGFLFVALELDQSILRVRTATQQIDQRFDLAAAGYPGIVSDMLAVAGAPQSILVAVGGGVVRLDGGTARPSVAGGFPSPIALARSSSPDLVYATADNGSMLAQIRLTAAGLLTERFAPFGGAFGGRALGFAAGRLFDDGGAVVDPGSGSLVASLGIAGALAADLVEGRVHFLVGDTLASFNANTLIPFSRVPVRGALGARRVVRWGVAAWRSAAGMVPS